jgi:FMN phosphatase YigB (HAD superfamily)
LNEGWNIRFLRHRAGRQSRTVPSAVEIAAVIKAIARFPIVSCDIFDTAVMRRLARPEDALLATGARARALGLTSCSPQAFAEYRLEAERFVRRDALAQGYDEIRLAEVCARMQACGLTEDGFRLAELEFAVERSVCRSIEPVRKMLAARNPKQRVIFLSDTMLPGDWLAQLLDDCGYGKDCVIFASSDARKSKHTGRLFAHVVEALGCPASDIIHVGDNPTTDIARAAEHRIKTYHLPWPGALPERDDVAVTDWPVRLVHSHRRSRWALSEGAKQPLKPHVADVGSLHRYVSILLIGFSLFVLAEARRRNIRRIYFLARDGYLPLAITKRLVERTGESFELSYLHVSRQSIVVPAMTDNLPKLAEDISQSMLNRPVHTALDFIGIDASTTSHMFRDIGLAPDQPAGSPAGMESIRRLFAAYGELIGNRLQERRAAALSYLDQSGFLAPGPRLIVDVGWRGSTQTALAELTGLPPFEIAGCYLGLLPQALRPRLDPRTAAGYLFSFGDPKPAMDMVLEGYALFELFFSAPHGSTLHYALNEGRAVPVLAVEEEPGASIRREAFAAIEAGCLKEFETLDRILDRAWPEAIDPKSALFDIERLLLRPTVQDVATINTIPFIAGINGGRNLVAVNPVPLHEFLLGLNRAIRRMEHSPWRSGSVRASTPWPIPSMSFQDFRHRVRRLQCLFGRQ